MHSFGVLEGMYYSPLGKCQEAEGKVFLVRVVEIFATCARPGWSSTYKKTDIQDPSVSILDSLPYFARMTIADPP